MRRIHIIGGPGSGKTGLAERLSSLMKVPHYSLDSLAYSDDLFQVARPREERIRLVSEYCSLSEWISEGVYFSWVGKSFRAADMIVVLSVPQHFRAQNIRNKIIARQAGGFASENPELNYLLAKNEEFDSLFDERISGFLRPFNEKVKFFDGPGKALKYLQRIV